VKEYDTGSGTSRQDKGDSIQVIATKFLAELKRLLENDSKLLAEE
jgi:hypothetical protein